MEKTHGKCAKHIHIGNSSTIFDMCSGGGSGSGKDSGSGSGYELVMVVEGVAVAVEWWF